MEAKIEEARSRQQYAVADRLSAKALAIINRDLEKKVRFEGEMARWARLAENFSKRVEESKQVAESQLVKKQQVAVAHEASPADLLEEALKKEMARRVQQGLYVNKHLVETDKCTADSLYRADCYPLNGFNYTGCVIAPAKWSSAAPHNTL